MKTDKSIKEQVDELKIVGVSGDNKPDGTYIGIPMELPQDLADELEGMAVRALEIANRLGVDYLDIHATGSGNKWGPLVLCRVSENLQKFPQTVFEKRLDDGCQSMRD